MAGKCVEKNYSQRGLTVIDLLCFNLTTGRLLGCLNMQVWLDKKITPKAWQKELDGLKERYQKTERPLSDATLDLAKMEVLNHNKRDLERMLENESHKRTVSRDRNITL